MKKLKVVITCYNALSLLKLSKELRNRVKNEDEGVDIVFTANPAETFEEIRDAKILFGYLSPEIFKAAEKLKWNQYPEAGLEHYLFPPLVESDIIITHSAGIYSEEIADHVFAFITAFSRDLPKLIRRQDQEIWEKHEKIKTISLLNKTLGVVGLGGIGTEVAKRGIAFQMRVIATRAHPERGKPSFVDKLWGPDGLDHLLQESDFVVICTPDTPKTENMIKAKELRTMKKTAFLINVGRGIIVSLEDLTEALRKGNISGAGLDVFEQEPLPKGHRLWKMKNVIITPHSATLQEYLYQERRIDLFLKNLRRFIEEKSLINVIDKKMYSNTNVC